MSTSGGCSGGGGGGAGGGCNTGSSCSLPRGNISVTSINCEDGSTTNLLTTTNGQQQQQHFYGNGITISVPKIEESDESELESELKNIEQSAKVAMRNNRTSKIGDSRPMSWENELSETEDMMDIENSNDPTKLIQFLSNVQPVLEKQTEQILFNDNNVIRATDTIKPEYGLLTNLDPNTTIAYATSNNKKYHPDFVSLKYESGIHDTSPPLTAPITNILNSPLLQRATKSNLLPANPSPDSAIHSVYTHSSPSQSPLTSRHPPYTPSLSRNNSDASHSSCYSYSSEFSPTHSPIQGRHSIYGQNSNNVPISSYNGSPRHHSILYRPIIDGGEQSTSSMRIVHQQQQHHHQHQEDNLLENDAIPSAGISRQQLINSPCPICCDKVSGFHYGIFSCESCKGFFKRTVQNRKNYVCLRGAACPVTIATRKKCPACRFEKCLHKGMKLEAIREDRTRGGRSTYQCSYTLPGTMLSPSINSDYSSIYTNSRIMPNGPILKTEAIENSGTVRQGIPPLLQEIMDVEPLWHYNEDELSRLNQPPPLNQSSSAATNPLLASAGLKGDISNPDLIATLCNVADHRLYKIVKWCKSLPLFKNISIDDQICLLINSWCELLLFSCCFRSMISPGEIRISLGKSITLQQAKASGLQVRFACIERMLNLTDHLRRLRVDRYEYVAMKVIVLLQSDTSELREPEKVRTSQEKALQALQAYTLSHYPETPSKFGELLLRIPELQRTCQVGKEMLTIKSKDSEDFNLLMELLRGEH